MPSRRPSSAPKLPSRRDFAWPSAKLGVEIEGGIYSRGRHGRGSGIAADIEKGNALTLLGWRLLRFHGDQVRSGEAVETIRQAFRPAEEGR